LERWSDRKAFSAGYFESASARFRDHANLLVERANWVLGAGPTRRNQPPEGMTRQLDNELPRYAEVRLSNWPFRLYTRWPDWEAFLAGGYREGLAGEALRASEQIIREVKQVVPDRQVLFDLLEESYR